MIRVQREDFDIGQELERLSAGDHAIGGVASFVGLVRDMGGPEPVSALGPGLAPPWLPLSSLPSGSPGLPPPAGLL